MGGVLIIISSIIPPILWAGLSNPFIWLVMFSTIGFGAIGFTDDYLKIVNKRNLGLTARMKLLLQFIAACAIGLVLVGLAGHKLYSTELMVPFFKQFRPDFVIEALRNDPHLWPLAFAPFVIVMMLLLEFSSNSVSITD